MFELYDALPEDPMFRVSRLAAQDTRPNLVDLTIGIYKTSELRSTKFKSVRDAEAILLKEETDKDYFSIAGHDALITAATELVLGDFNANHVTGIQALGGTGSLYLGAKLLSEQVKAPAFISTPTWVNHKNIFSSAGFDVQDYHYYDRSQCVLLFDKVCDTLRKAPKSSVFIFHGCCHNPSGIDPTLDQWKELAELCKARSIIPFFDLAYQGFGDGLNEDVAAIRYFAEMGLEMLVGCSFSKNLGLYGERVGALLVIGAEQLNVASHLKAIIRASYSNPPRHGALVAAQVLQDRQLRQNWEMELTEVRNRIDAMRQKLILAFQEIDSHLDVKRLGQCRGMFLFLDLTSDQIHALREDHAIYLTESGRMNVAGLNEEVIPYVAASILKVVKI